MYQKFGYFFNYMEFNLMKISRKETIKFSDNSIYGAFILGQQKQQFNINYYFVILYPIIG